MTILDVVVDHPRADVPALSGAQEQDDLIVLPRPLVEPASTPIPSDGVELVGSTVGGVHRLLSGDGPDCLFDVRPGGPAGLVLGALTVPVDATAYLVLDEGHGIIAFAQGTYEVRRSGPVTTGRRASRRAGRRRRS